MAVMSRRRLVHRAERYRHVFVSGVETVCNDEFTGELRGRSIRGAHTG
jgi:hypothetical protein